MKRSAIPDHHLSNSYAITVIKPFAHRSNDHNHNLTLSPASTYPHTLGTIIAAVAAGC